MTGRPLLNGFFETAYVTRDMDAGLAIMASRDGVKDFLVFAPPATRGPVSHIAKVAKAFVGARMIELIQPNPAVQSIFAGFLPDDDDGLRLHHLGYLIEDDAHWDGMRALAAAQGIEVGYEGFVPELVRSTFLDTRRQLGHYCEYIQNYAGGRDLMDRIPRN